MTKKIWIFLGAFFFVLIFDQAVKLASINGLRAQNEFLDLVLVYNTGVSFSIFSSLGKYLIVLNSLILLALFIYLLWQKELLKKHTLAFALMLSGGFSNLLDRFFRPGVVDMFFWHKWFEFAVFNIADVMINLSVILILLREFFFKKSLNVK